MDQDINKSIFHSPIRLRALELSDAIPMLEWLLDPIVYEKMQYSPQEQNLEKCEAFIRNSWIEQQNLHYAITNEKNEYLGTVSLKNVDRSNYNAELAIVLCPKAMGQGIAGLALQEIMRLAFVELKLNKVYLYVRCDNERAVAFYKKCNLTYEGCFKEHIYAQGEFRDIYWFSLRKEEYNEWNGKQ